MHYRLVDAGYSRPRVMVMMLVGNALVVGLGLILTLISPVLSLIVFIARSDLCELDRAAHTCSLDIRPKAVTPEI